MCITRNMVLNTSLLKHVPTNQVGLFSSETIGANGDTNVDDFDSFW